MQAEVQCHNHEAAVGQTDPGHHNKGDERTAGSGTTEVDKIAAHQIAAENTIEIRFLTKFPEP